MAGLQICLAEPDKATAYPPHCLQAPPTNSKELFLGHAALEETYGLAKRSREVYDAAVRTVPPEERLEVYNLFVSRASQFFGVGKVTCFMRESWGCLRPCMSAAPLQCLLRCNAGAGGLASQLLCALGPPALVVGKLD